MHYQCSQTETHAFCNCGMAVLSGDDVIKIDRCPKESDLGTPTVTYGIFLNGDLTAGTKIYNWQNIYKVDCGRKLLGPIWA